MKGLYLYCIRERTDFSSLSIRGIDGKHAVTILAFEELEAVVSKISVEEFASEEIQKKAKEDLNWIKEKALAHERVIEEAMRRNGKLLSLIPMRFGTVFKNIKSLEESLKKNYSNFIDVLERLRGRQEWSVKAYLKDKKIFEQMIKKNNKAVRAKEMEIAALPEGMAYFVEQELREIISEEEEKELNNITEYIFESLKKQAVASVKNKILEKELMGRPEPMVLNAAYLVPEDGTGVFLERIKDVDQQIQTIGFYLEYSGPWPAYSFSSHD